MLLGLGIPAEGMHYLAGHAYLDSCRQNFGVFFFSFLFSLMVLERKRQ